jgi:hypothetical protein
MKSLKDFIGTINEGSYAVGGERGVFAPSTMEFENAYNDGIELWSETSAGKREIEAAEDNDTDLELRVLQEFFYFLERKKAKITTFSFKKNEYEKCKNDAEVREFCKESGFLDNEESELIVYTTNDDDNNVVIIEFPKKLKMSDMKPLRKYEELFFANMYVDEFRYLE